MVTDYGQTGRGDETGQARPLLAVAKVTVGATRARKNSGRSLAPRALQARPALPLQLPDTAFARRSFIELARLATICCNCSSLIGKSSLSGPELLATRD